MGLGTHFFISIVPVFLEEFKLLGGFGGIDQLPAAVYLHHSELLIGNTHYPNMTFRRKNALNPFDMNLRIFLTATVPDIHTELEHRKAIF